MDKKGILVGLIAATVVTGASASVDSINEKQKQAQVMSNLLGGITTVMYHPECTIKSSDKKK